MTRRLVSPLLAVMLAMVSAAAAAQSLADERSRREAVRAFQNGQEFMSAEQFEKAADEFTRAIERDPLFTLAYYQLGQAYMNLRRYPRAIDAFMKALDASRGLYFLSEENRFQVERRREDDIRLMREYVQELQHQGRQVLAAAAEGQLHDLENNRTSQSTAFQPPAEILLSLGSAYFRSGARDQAEAEWNAAIKVNPKFGEAYSNLAVVYMLTGRKREAESAVRSAEKTGFRVNPLLKKDISAMGAD